VDVVEVVVEEEDEVDLGSSNLMSSSLAFDPGFGVVIHGG
jgi:hypothetical protein